MTLKISISGIRGITGESLTDEVVSDFSRAFASYIKRGVVVAGRDPRASGEKIKDIVISNLNSMGIDVTYLGICPTPTVQLMVKELKADGGIIITASHNPAQWNGLKFVRSDGIFLNKDEAERLIGIYEKRSFIVPARTGSLKIQDKPLDPHIKKVLGCVDVQGIRKRKFKVVLDSCNGAGSVITVELLKELGCEVIELYTDTKKPFPHNPEPIPANLKDLCEKVKAAGADIGFAQDADADRLAVVTEKGTAPGEEYTLAIVAEHILSISSAKGGSASGGKTPSPKIVTNLSTSMMVDDIAKKYGAKVIRTRIGEVNVAEEMVKQKALIGGEGNGGIMYPKVGYARDSLAGIGLILDSLSRKGKSASSAIDGLPKYFIVKEKVACSSKDEAASFMEKVKRTFTEETLDLTEGIKVIYKNAWVHVRPSNTEPAIRIIAEAESAEKALELIDKVMKSRR
ncbi:MAG: phosphoglucosamine mutase [bacterium]